MAIRKSIFGFAIIIWLTALFSACQPQEEALSEAEIAIAVALTQTAIAQQAQAPTASTAPSATPESSPTPEAAADEAQAGQESELMRIEFEEGATGTQLIGRITPGSVDHYVLRAEAGQKLSLNLYPPGVVAIAVVGEDGEVLKSDLDNVTEWSGEISLSQEYYFDVTSLVNIESEYTLDVSIPPLEPIATTGEVSGAIGYPEEIIPQLHVVAYNLQTNFWYYVAAGPNTTFYVLPGLPPGEYHVTAYAKDGLDAAYMSGGALVEVTVEAGETTEGIDLTQWFAAGSGPYPTDPVGW